MHESPERAKVMLTPTSSASVDEAYTDFLYSYKAVAQNPSRDVRLVGRLRF